MKRYIITALCAFMVHSVLGQLTYTTNIPTLSQLSYSVVGDSCVELNLPRAEKTHTPEQPEVPIYYYTFILPTNSKIVSIEPLSPTTSGRNIPFPVKCSPPAMTANGDIVYSLNNEIPQYLTTPLYVVSEGYFDGDIHLVTVAYSPIRYTKGSNTLQFVRIPQFRINLQSGRPEGLSPISPCNRNHSERVSMILSMVDNPQNVENWIPQSPNVSPDSILLGNSGALPGIGYEYLVITTRKLYETAQKLIKWKRTRGVNAGIVCYEDIRDIDIPDTQSDYEEIDDEAGHLRKYLRNACAKGLEYVFLVSERGEIPYRRYFYREYPSEKTPTTPTDFYYAELTGKWSDYQSQHNSYTYTDNIAEIAVGRLFVSNNEEWSSYIDRLITYERNPGNGNPQYLMNAFFIQSDDMQKYGHAQYIADSINNIFATNIWNEIPGEDSLPSISSFPKGKEVIDRLQNTPCGYFATFAHGGQMSINTFSGGNNSGSCHSWVIRSVENDTITNAWKFLTNNDETSLEPGAGIDRLNLPNNPFIVYSMSCTTMPYDTVLNHIKTEGFAFNPITVGVAFTAKSKSAIAYLGNTRVGLYSTFGYPDRHSTKMQNIFNKYIIEENNHIGKAENYSRIKINDLYLAATHNLLGCPEIPMWTAIPQKQSTPNNTDIVYVTPLFSNDTTIIISYGDALSDSKYAQNHSIAKIRENYYPLFLPLKLQNFTLQSSHTVFCDDVSIGEKVNPNTEQGEFMIDYNGGIAIETTGTVTLSSGTTIRTGGTLSIKHIKQ